MGVFSSRHRFGHTVVAGVQISLLREGPLSLAPLSSGAFRVLSPGETLTRDFKWSESLRTNYAGSTPIRAWFVYSSGPIESFAADVHQSVTRAEVVSNEIAIKPTGS